MWQLSLANSLHASGLPDRPNRDLRPKQRRVESQLTGSFSAIQGRLPILRRKRCFSNASPDEMLSFLLLRLKFCGADGLMTDSTVDSEECCPSTSSIHLELQASWNELAISGIF